MEKNPNFHTEVILTGKEKYSLLSQVVLQFYAKYTGDCDMSVLLGVSDISTKNTLLSFCAVAFINHKVGFVPFMYYMILLVLFCRVK